MSDGVVGAALSAGFCVGVLVGFFLGGVYTKGEWQSWTVELDLAQYCPKTGGWAWKGECEERDSGKDWK